MRTFLSTNVRPLILNFAKPEVPQKVTADQVDCYYDPVSQVTYYLGGGTKNPTRSNDGYKRTDEKSGGSNCYYTHNDAERWTDD